MKPFLLGAPSQARILDLIDYAVQGAWPADDCTACARLGGGRCEECAGRLADIEDFENVRQRVRDSGTGTDALGVFLALMAAIAEADMNTRAAVGHAARTGHFIPVPAARNGGAGE